MFEFPPLPDPNYSSPNSHIPLSPIHPFTNPYTLHPSWNITMLDLAPTPVHITPAYPYLPYTRLLTPTPSLSPSWNITMLDLAPPPDPNYSSHIMSSMDDTQEDDWEGGDNSAKLFERSRIKALAGLSLIHFT